METISLSQARDDMGRHFGPPPKVGWLAALKDGKVVMCAGKAANHIFMLNAAGQNLEIRKIVKDEVKPGEVSLVQKYCNAYVTYCGCGGPQESRAQPAAFRALEGRSRKARRQAANRARSH